MKSLLLLMIMCCLSLTACAEQAYWWDRTLFGIDCRPAYTDNGHCTPVPKGAKADAQTAHP
jgi:hypothetical protein